MTSEFAFDFRNDDSSIIRLPRVFLCSAVSSAEVVLQMRGLRLSERIFLGLPSGEWGGGVDLGSALRVAGCLSFTPRPLLG